MWIDSHVNLHGEKFEDDLDAVVEAARAAGVAAMLTICCKLSEFDAVHALTRRYDKMYCSVGTHPHEARENPDITPEDLIKHTDDDKVIGIGETGLDFHYNYSDAEDQYRNFDAHIKASRETGLPLIIHSRNADAEMAKLLESEMAKGAFPHLLHCYTGGPDLAARSLALGGYIAFSGILTFKNAHDIREIAKSVPDDRILIETDCPYLAPMPHRGRRCEPSMVVHTGEVLAGIKGWSLEQTAAATSDAFYALFTKARK